MSSRPTSASMLSMLPQPIQPIPGDSFNDRILLLLAAVATTDDMLTYREYQLVQEAAQAIFRGLQSVFAPRGVYLAAQCCEHLNRALIVEHEAVPNAEIVNVLPQPKAGSSFATAAYESFRHPVALEEIRADAGLDIGGTLIGMHLKKVAVPVRLKQDHIGQAIVLAARVRPKFIGGERAIYNEELKNGYPDFDAE